MKALSTIVYNNQHTLTVLMEEIEDGKAAISYFINTFEISEWSSILPVFQELFTIMADSICKSYNLKKSIY